MSLWAWDEARGVPGRWSLNAGLVGDDPPEHEQHLATGVDADQQVAFLKPLPKHLIAQQ